MSDAVSALQGSTFDGLVRIADAGLRGMVTVKGDLADARLQEVLVAISGTGFPAPREAHVAGDKGLVWMAPDEVLLLGPYAETEAAAVAVSDALAGTHCLAVNVSDARMMISLSGPLARDVLAKLTPVDLDPSAFGPGQIHRTRIAQVPAAFWMTNAETFEIVAFRSVARYVFDVLTAAGKPGSGVGYF